MMKVPLIATKTEKFMCLMFTSLVCNEIIFFN